MQKILLSSMLSLGLAAFAAAAADHATTLVGKLNITGNEPFPTVTLLTDDRTAWEMVGFPLEQARTLSGQRVKVQGTVTRPAGPGVWRPAIRVEGTPADVQILIDQDSGASLSKPSIPDKGIPR